MQRKLHVRFGEGGGKTYPRGQRVPPLLYKAKLEARRAGHTVTEQALPDGSIKLTVAVGGGAA